MLSALVGVWLTGGDNNMFVQVGLVVLMGLACKNAILIVEFARELELQGKGIVEAALEACRLRLRPIVMTSIAFIAGTVPLVLAPRRRRRGARATGITVFAGMLGVTLFGLFLTPVFYVALRKLVERRRGSRPATADAVDGLLPGVDPAGGASCLIRNVSVACDRWSLRLSWRPSAACAVGPDYRRPDLPVPDAFTGDAARIARGAGEAMPTVARAQTTAPLPDPDAPFWRRFEDPLLDELIETALRENHDLRVALARYDEANALLREARFDHLPTVTAQGGAADSRSSVDQVPGATRTDRDTDSRWRQVNVAWELDLVGRLRRNVESQRAEAAANAADLAALQVAIVGEVARSYLELRGLQERLQVARDNAGNQRETLRIVEARLDAGRGTDFDTSRARAQLEAPCRGSPPSPLRST